MNIIFNQPCDEKIKGYYENVIRNTRLFFNLLNYAKDPAAKQPWIKAGLLDANYGDELNKKIVAAIPGELFRFTLDEAIQLYTCIDVCCRFYLSPMGEKVRQSLVDKGITKPENLERELKFTTGSSEEMISLLKDALDEYPSFNQAAATLKKLDIPDFDSELLDEDADDDVTENQ